MSADDRRNALLKDLESRMAICEVLTAQQLDTQKKQNDQVHQISKKLVLLTEHMQTVSSQLTQISLLLVHIAKNSTTLVQQSVDETERDE